MGKRAGYPNMRNCMMEGYITLDELKKINEN